MFCGFELAVTIICQNCRCKFIFSGHAFHDFLDFQAILTEFEWSSEKLWIILSSESMRERIYAILSDFGSHFGAMLASFWPILSSKVDVSSRHVSGQNLYRFWSRFGVDLGAKMSPLGSSRALGQRKCDFVKKLVLLKQNLCFWGSESSETLQNRVRERCKRRVRFRCVFDIRIESILSSESSRFWVSLSVKACLAWLAEV